MLLIILDTLQEAHEAALGKQQQNMGRGCRTIKPTDYFSPAEELEKETDKKRMLKKSKYLQCCA